MQDWQRKRAADKAALRAANAAFGGSKERMQAMYGEGEGEGEGEADNYNFTTYVADDTGVWEKRGVFGAYSRAKMEAKTLLSSPGVTMVRIITEKNYIVYFEWKVGTGDGRENSSL